MPIDTPGDSSGNETQSAAPGVMDVVIVGAGFAGLYLLHRLRGLGLSARAYEAGGGVGGTWYWNRYPGARCDIESMQYSFSFDDALQQEWQWPERFSAQPEILAYANHVADRFCLRRDIQLNTRVTSAHFNEHTDRWLVTTDGGERIDAQFCVMATGCLSSTQVPTVNGRDRFRGATYHTGQWPHHPVDFTGQRVAVIGTGSSAIQAIPVIAEQARHLTVFQRTPNYSIPSRNGPMTSEYERSWKADYAGHRARARLTPNGVLPERNQQSALELDDADRLAAFESRWAAGGVAFMGAFNDLAVNKASNDTAAAFVRDKIRTTVTDPAVAELLAAKDYPIGTKRICVDTNYFETFNRDNVSLIDIKASPIETFTENGLVSGGHEQTFDSVVFATGFDAMTGTLLKIDIRGRDGVSQRAKWADGPRTYLGLTMAGFPNLFLITGPGSPSVLSNMMVSIEQHVEWVTDAMAHMHRHGLGTMEATADAEESWVQHVHEVGHKTLYPLANSWYMGVNIPGKPRKFMPYIGGVGTYRQQCNEIVASDYAGFSFDQGEAARTDDELPSEIAAEAIA